jgi:hypothetical protein
VATGRGTPVTLDEFFAGHDEARAVFEAVRAAIDTIGANEVRATRSQVAFRRRTGFAWVWRPDQYLHAKGMAPLVLTVDLRRRDPSPRWKQVVEASPGHFAHHLELRERSDVDDEVRLWLGEAWDAAA